MFVALRQSSDVYATILDSSTHVDGLWGSFIGLMHFDEIFYQVEILNPGGYL